MVGASTGLLIGLLLIGVSAVAVAITIGNISRFEWWSWALFVVAGFALVVAVSLLLSRSWRLAGVAFVVVGLTMPTGLGAIANVVLVVLALPLVLLGNRLAPTP